ncbi:MULTISPECIES: hypothetical protein [Microbacterium]|uniref:hypothetical protein n=1 Tax=Microbacterium TaxID=33882 RepID=UPI00146B130E|nr:MULTISPECIES: hypothetical protein [Microbacterium]
MIDRAHTETTLWRTAVSAFSYYPTKHVDEPGYTVGEDIEWCLEPLSEVDQAVLARLSDLVATAIVDPTAHRTELTKELERLADR